MKLFNINIDFKTIQKIFKLIIILLLVFYCIYILYFSSNLVEGFSDNLDCSNCQMKPSSGDCIPIYDFSYSLQNTNEEIDQSGISFETIDTDYVFCPWEANCTRDHYLANMNDQEARLAMTNEDFYLEYNKGLNNITCCSGEPFYDTNTTSYFSAYRSVDLSFDFDRKCSDFSDTFFSDFFINNDDELKNLQFTNLANLTNSLNTDNLANMNYIIDKNELNRLNETNKKIINKLYNNTNFNKIRTFCSNHDYINRTDDFSGMLFKKSSVSQNILLDPDLTIQEIFDYQNTLELSYNTLPDGTRERVQTITYSNRTFTIDEINDQLRELSTNPNQIKSSKGYTQEDLQRMISKFFDSTISYEDISYILVNSSLAPITNPINNTEYLLNENEFLNCFGDISNTQDMRFSEEQQKSIKDSLSIENIGKNNFFGVSDENIKTVSEVTPSIYGAKNDLEMELTNLQTVQPGGTAPVSVINQYLTAINGFYENQIQNLIGPRTHAINDQVVFDNNTLETKTNTFLTYENEENNSYECTNSITNDEKFKYCGPTPYYSSF